MISYNIPLQSADTLDRLDRMVRMNRMRSMDDEYVEVNVENASFLDIFKGLVNEVVETLSLIHI